MKEKIQKIKDLVSPFVFFNQQQRKGIRCARDWVIMLFISGTLILVIGIAHAFVYLKVNSVNIGSVNNTETAKVLQISNDRLDTLIQEYTQKTAHFNSLRNGGDLRTPVDPSL